MLWIQPEKFPVLEAQTVHVWSALLNNYYFDLKELENLLSADEIERAYRFKFEKDRQRFIAARGLLRKMLGRYLSREPKQLIFHYGEHGKPFVENIFFNLSHSATTALFAFSTDFEVGIDLESIDERHRVDELAKRFFAKQEYDQLQQLTGVEKTQAFFSAWACKEAFLKALGAGLSYPLNQVILSLELDKPAKILALQNENLNDWSICRLNLSDDFAAALVTKGKPVAIKTWEII